MRAARALAVGRVVGVCVAATLAAGCEAPSAKAERAELQAARQRVTELEAELAQRDAPEPPAEDVTEQPEEWKRHALNWRKREVPGRVSAGAFDRPEQLLAALAGELIELRPGEGGDNAILRLRAKGTGFIGEIGVRNLPDDSAGALEFRAVLVQRGGRWRAAALSERVICRRGGSQDACL